MGGLFAKPKRFMAKTRAITGPSIKITSPDGRGRDGGGSGELCGHRGWLYARENRTCGRGTIWMDGRSVAWRCTRLKMGKVSYNQSGGVASSLCAKISVRSMFPSPLTFDGCFTREVVCGIFWACVLTGLLRVSML